MKKNAFKSFSLSISTIVLLSMAGCSGGGSDVSSAVSTALSGVGIDGILVGSTVCIDVDGSGTCDAGEASAITDSEGKFTIPATTQTGPLLLIGGVDNSTGQAFTGSLKAPAGSTVVTPLTSAVQSLVESGKSPAEAEANVKAALGVPSDVQLTSFDPYQEINDTNATNAGYAKTVLAKQTQLQVLVHSATVTIAGADANTDVNTTMGSVFDAIASNFSGASTLVTLDAAKVSAATKTAADKVYVANPSARVATKVVAQTAAENAVRDADNAENIISSGTVANATSNLDAAITKVNTTTETALKQASVDAKTAADGLDDTKIAEIEALQNAQQEAEAATIAAQTAQATAEAEAAAAAATAASVLADATATAEEQRAAYEAQLTAEAQAAQAASDLATADYEAALAAQAAAAQEALIAAEAAQREAAAQAAAAQALAAQAQAQAIQAAAEQAQAAAQAAADLATAQAAVAAAQAAAEVGIAQATVNTYVQMASFYAFQAGQDANETRTMATALVDTAADANATLAETARDAAIQAAIDANVSIDTNDINGSLTTSFDFKELARTQAGIAEIALENTYSIQMARDLAVAAELALQAKRDRIQVVNAAISQIYTDVNTSFNDLNVSQVFADLEVIQTIYNDYPTDTDLQQALADANTSSVLGEAAYNTAGLELEKIALAISNGQVAFNDANETQAAVALANANTAKEAFTLAIATATTNKQAIADVRIQVEAIRDALVFAATSSGFVFTDGLVVGDFRVDDTTNTPIATVITLSGGTLSETQYTLGSDGVFTVDTTPSTDYELINGIWTASSADINYSVSSDGTVVTTGSGNEVKVAQEVNLTTVPDSTNLDIVTQINANVPGDTNVTFSTGAQAYVFAIKNPDRYELYKIIVDENNTEFTDMVSAINRPRLSVGSFEVNATTYYNVTFEKDVDKNVIDSNGTIVTTLTEGLTGNLVVGQTGDAAGNWKVVTLPNLTSLAIELNVTVDTSTGYSNSLIAINANVTNSPVMKGDFIPASADFIINPEYVSFNQIAFDDIKAAIEAYAQSQIVDTSALVGEWVDVNTTLYLTLDNNFTITDTDLNTTDNGVYVIDNVVDIGGGDLEGNVTMTFDTNTSDTCGFGLYGTTLNVTCSTVSYSFTKSVTATISRTIPEIGSWYNETNGIHLSFLDDASYMLVVNTVDTLGANGVQGGIELGYFDVNATDYSLSNFATVINSSGGDTLVGSAITYDATNDTLALDDGTTIYAFVRDDGNSTNPDIGTWLSPVPNAPDEVIVLTLHSDGTYMSGELNTSASDFVDNSGTTGGIYNAFELGTFATSIVDTNATITFTKDATTDYDDVFGPPAGDIVFDITNYPTIIGSSPDGNITFEKVVLP